jgi:hypothetical protein
VSNLQKEEDLTISAPAIISWKLGEQKLIITERINLKLTKIKVGNAEVVYSVSTDLYLTNKVLFQKWEYDSKNQSMKVTASR